MLTSHYKIYSFLEQNLCDISGQKVEGCLLFKLHIFIMYQRNIKTETLGIKPSTLFYQKASFCKCAHKKHTVILLLCTQDFIMQNKALPRERVYKQHLQSSDMRSECLRKRRPESHKLQRLTPRRDCTRRKLPVPLGSMCWWA